MSHGMGKPGRRNAAKDERKGCCCLSATQELYGQDCES